MTPHLVSEKLFFASQQPILRQMMATRYGRQLLCITERGENPIEIRPNHLVWRVGADTRLSEFRTRSKFSRVIRHRWKEYVEYSDYLIKQDLEPYRREAARLGLAFAGGGTVTTVYPDPDP